MKPTQNIQSNQNLEDELQVRDNQIQLLNDRIIIQDHELRELRSVKGSLDRLKRLEQELDTKDQTISDLKKKIMAQEEAIGSWLDMVEQKKKLISEKDIKIKKIEDDNQGLSIKNDQIQDKLKEIEEQLRISQEEKKLLKQNLDENKNLVEQLKKQHEQLDHLYAELKQDYEQQITHKNQQIESQNQRIQQIYKESEEKVEQLLANLHKINLEYDQDRNKLQEEKRELQNDYQILKEEFEKFKHEKAIEDLLVVKFDIDTIDEGLLLDKDTKIEDLEKEKAKLERRVSQISEEFNLVLTDQKSLNEKVQLFQTKCKHLEDQLNKSNEQLSDEIKSLKRTNQLLLDKNDNLQKAQDQLTKQFEYTLDQKKEEQQKLKREHETQLQKEKDRCIGIENKFKKSLLEKEVLEQQLKSFFEQLSKVEEKIDGKNVEIQQLQAQISKLMKQVNFRVIQSLIIQIEDHRSIVKKIKQTHLDEIKELDKKYSEKDSEIQVLKEMVKGTKLQLKSKDTDIQRLQIKIKRLEKTNEIRESVIMETQSEFKQLKQPPQMISNPSKQSLVERARNHMSFENQDINRTAIEDQPYPLLPPISNGQISATSSKSKNYQYQQMSAKNGSSKVVQNLKKQIAQSKNDPSQEYQNKISSVAESRQSKKRNSTNRGYGNIGQGQGGIPNIKKQNSTRHLSFLEQSADQLMVSAVELTGDGVVDDFMEQQREIMKELTYF